MRVHHVVVATALLGGCCCSPGALVGNQVDGGISLAPTAPPPIVPVPPTRPMPPPTTPNHIGLPADAAAQVTAFRSAINARDNLAIRAALADSPIRYTNRGQPIGPTTADAIAASWNAAPAPLTDIAEVIDRGCLGQDGETEDTLSILCPAEAADDDYTGTSVAFIEGPRGRWKVAEIDIGPPPPVPPTTLEPTPPPGF